MCRAREVRTDLGGSADHAEREHIVPVMVGDPEKCKLAAMDLFVVPTIGLRLLYGFVIVRLHRRDLV
jgi:hypothetical protein